MGNAGDGVLSLFEGGESGLALLSTSVEPNLPSPPAWLFRRYPAIKSSSMPSSAGREAASLVAMSLGGETLAQNSTDAALGTFSNVAQLVPISETSLALVGSLLTLTIASPDGELASESADAASIASVATSIGSLGQSNLRSDGGGAQKSPWMPMSSIGTRDTYEHRDVCRLDVGTLHPQARSGVRSFPRRLSGAAF